MARILIILVLFVLFMAVPAHATEEWILGQPVQTDTTNYEWSLGSPYVITEVEAPVPGRGQVIMITSLPWILGIILLYSIAYVRTKYKAEAL